MNFTEEQQSYVDGLIKKKYAEAHAKAEAKAAEQLTAAEAKHAEEANTLKAELEKLKAAQGESNERVRKAFLEAKVARTDAVNAAQVMKLVSDAFIIGDDGELAVVDEKGVMRLDSAGRPLTAEVFLEGFLDENPHLKKAARLTGAGSTGAGFNLMAGATTTRRSDFNQMSPSRQAEFIRGGGRLTE